MDNLHPVTEPFENAIGHGRVMRAARTCRAAISHGKTAATGSENRIRRHQQQGSRPRGLKPLRALAMTRGER
jgi:hypothetical protein